MPAAKPTKKPAPVTLLVATRKGAFVVRSDDKRKKWTIDGPHFLGSIVHHLVADPRDGKTWLMAARDGHLGPTVFRSTDAGRSWKEAARPPAFAKTSDGNGKSVQQVFWLTPGHGSQPGVWYAGTSPHALFRSPDGGVTWDEVATFRAYLAALGKPDLFGATPDGEITHSILIDPRNASHLYVGLSTGGFFASIDEGKTWRPLNAGVESDFLPAGADHELGHDPHCVVLHPKNPDRLWQQNHCGIYRLDRPSDRWERVGRAMPKEIGDIGFPIAVHPRELDTAYVLPMDGTSVWPRVSPGGKPAIYRTRDAGRSWKRLDKGLPREHGWFTVKRQAFAVDDRDPLGLYFGTTSGEIWASPDEGARWTQIGAHLPNVYAVEIA